MMNDKELEWQQGRRLALAMVALIVAVPIFAGILLLPGFLVLEYIWGGVDAIRRVFQDWTRPSEFSMDPRYRFILIVMVAICVGLPIICWYRIFVSTGYVSDETNHRIISGNIPVIGGYWKPLMYAFVCISSGVGLKSGIEQGNIAGAVFFGAGGCWFFYRGIKELVVWWVKKKGK